MVTERNELINWGDNDMQETILWYLFSAKLQVFQRNVRNGRKIGEEKSRNRNLEHTLPS